MNGSASTKLYTPRLLGLAASLYNHPFDEFAPYIGEAQSRICGSTISASITCDTNGNIDRIGLAVKACAIGQASAAILAGDAVGRSPKDIAQMYDEIERWLEGTGPLPRWPGFDALEPALPHKGRHGALVIPWTAANQALSSPKQPG